MSVMSHSDFIDLKENKVGRKLFESWPFLMLIAGVLFYGGTMLIFMVLGMITTP